MMPPKRNSVAHIANEIEKLTTERVVLLDAIAELASDENAVPSDEGKARLREAIETSTSLDQA